MRFKSKDTGKTVEIPSEVLHNPMPSTARGFRRHEKRQGVARGHAVNSWSIPTKKAITAIGMAIAAASGCSNVLYKDATHTLVVSRLGYDLKAGKISGGTAQGDMFNIENLDENQQLIGIVNTLVPLAVKGVANSPVVAQPVASPVSPVIGVAPMATTNPTTKPTK